MKEKDYYKYQIGKIVEEISDTEFLRFIYIFLLDMINDDG